MHERKKNEGQGENETLDEKTGRGAGKREEAAVYPSPFLRPKRFGMGRLLLLLFPSQPPSYLTLRTFASKAERSARRKGEGGQDPILLFPPPPPPTDTVAKRRRGSGWRHLLPRRRHRWDGRELRRGGREGGAVLPFLVFLPQPQHNVCLSQAVGVSFLGNRVTSHKDRIPLLGRARMGWETPLIPSFSAPSFSFA